jgi:FkbM family methyltransferase
MDILGMIVDLTKCGLNIQLWFNHRYYDPTKSIIDNSIVKYIITKEGLCFHPFAIETLSQVIEEYEFEDLTQNDIVLDLGANIGAFSLRAARLCKHVYAVEPLYTDELNANIILNNLQDKITVLPYGVGNGNKIQIRYQNREKTVQTYPLSELLKMTGKITFLKCDIEGAEWTIQKEDLIGINRLEFETHRGRDSCLPENKSLLEYIHQNWKTKTELKPIWNRGGYIHAYPKTKEHPEDYNESNR